MGKAAEPDVRPQSSIPSITLLRNLSLTPPRSDAAYGILPRYLPLIEIELEIPSQHIVGAWPVNQCTISFKEE